MSKNESTDLSWTGPGDPPEPPVFNDAEPVDPDEVASAASHTGTDPDGRANGPAEDHTKRKVPAKKAAARRRS